MDGVRLATLFSYQPNKLNYCGPKEAGSLFQSYLKNNANKEKVRDLLVRFEALYPYLKIIGEENSKGPFDQEVVEAYWTGNNLTELDKQAVVRLINMLNKRGLVDSIAKDLIKKIDMINRQRIPLTHLFHVLFIGVGSVTGSVPTIIGNMDKCRISWGTICQINNSHLIVEYHRLKNQDNKYLINENSEKIKLSYDRNILRNLNIKDVIAIHWGTAVKKISVKELNNLKHYTQKVIEMIPKL